MNNINIGVKVDKANATTELQALDKDINKIKESSNTLGLSFLNLKSATVIATSSIAALTVGYKLLLKTIDEGGAIDDLAQIMNVSTDAVQQLSFMAKKAGVTIQDLASYQTKLVMSAEKAISGNNELASSFTNLGVSIYDSTGKMKNQNTLFKEVLIGISKIENPTLRQMKAQQLLGKSAQELAPLYNEGYKKIEEYFSSMSDGITMSKDLVTQSAKVGDQIQILSAQFNTAKNEQLEPFVNILGMVLTKIIELRENPISIGVDPNKSQEATKELERLTSYIGKSNQEMLDAGLSYMDIVSVNQLALNKTQEETMRGLNDHSSNYVLYWDNITGKMESVVGKAKGIMTRTLKPWTVTGEAEAIVTKPKKTTGNNKVDDKNITTLTKSITLLSESIKGLYTTQTTLDTWLNYFQSDVTVLGSLGKQLYTFSKDLVDASKEITQESVFYKFIGKTTADVEKFEAFIKTKSLTVPTDLANIVSLENIYAKENSNTKDEKTFQSKLKKSYLNLDLLLNNPIYKELDKSSAKAKETQDNIVKLLKDIANPDTKKEVIPQLKESLKQAEKQLGMHKRITNSFSDMLDEENLLYKILSESSDLRSEEGLTQLLTPNLWLDKTDQGLLQNLGLFADKTADDVSRIVRDMVKRINESMPDIFLPENIARSFADYEEATKMIASMKISNMSGDKISERKAKAEAEANAEYEAMIDGYLQMEIGQAEYFALAEQAEIAHNERLKEIRETSANDYIQSIVNNGEMLKTAVFGITDEIANGRRQAGERALVDMQTRHTKELESAKLSARGMRALEAKQAAEIQAEKDKQAEAQYKADIASLWINSFINQGKAFAGAVGQFGFPAGPIIGGGLATAILVQTGIAQSNAKKHKGYEDGGIVPGNSMRGDNVPVNVNSREMILTQSQQKVLFDMANGRAQANSNQGNISVNIENFSGSDNELSKLEDMLLTLQNKNRIRGVIA